MENRELKACPFCGEEPTMTTVGNTSSNYDVGFDFYVKCYGCGISLPRQYEVRMTLENGELRITKDERNKAIEEWNKRGKKTNETD